MNEPDESVCNLSVISVHLCNFLLCNLPNTSVPQAISSLPHRPSQNNLTWLTLVLKSKSWFLLTETVVSSAYTSIEVLERFCLVYSFSSPVLNKLGSQKLPTYSQTERPSWETSIGVADLLSKLGLTEGTITKPYEEVDY